MTLGHGSHERSPWWCWASMLAIAIVALPGAMLAISSEPTSSEPEAAETEEEVAVATAPATVDAGESIIVIHAAIATGPVDEMRSVVSN